MDGVNAITSRSILHVVISTATMAGAMGACSDEVDTSNPGTETGTGTGTGSATATGTTTGTGTATSGGTTTGTECPTSAYAAHACHADQQGMRCEYGDDPSGSCPCDMMCGGQICTCSDGFWECLEWDDFSPPCDAGGAGGAGGAVGGAGGSTAGGGGAGG